MKKAMSVCAILLTMTITTFANENSGEKNQTFQIKPDFVILDHWFFVGTKDGPSKEVNIRSQPSVVHPGQRFGAKVRFATISKKKVKIKIELKVPGNPANFPFHNGTVTISQEKQTVNVETEVDGGKGSYAFQWGISDQDPKGQYMMSFSIEDNPVEAYSFKVD